MAKAKKLLGRFVREFEGQKRVRDNILIATKFAAYPWRLTPGQFVTACKSSLDRMQIEQIGIGQLHWSTANYAPLQELALWDGLVAMYEKGLVRAVGVSNYGPKQLVKIHDYLKARGVPLCSAQVLLSRLDFFGAKGISQGENLGLQMYREAAETVMCGLLPDSPTATSSRTDSY
ncbi:hypothetical protein L1049_005060 [Liquidambar formosana]|uniref:NADP-dependent oxidoreductase domain-containing protein n=1 Tax=Liquidambar formosana TaxID=63359 RepID=A0AAP0RQN1_LIQFO